jgi:hypothetical protein
VVAAAPSSVVFLSIWHWTATPPTVANKLARASTSALPPSTMQYLRRYCNKKLSDVQRRFFYAPPMKLAITLLPQTPCVTDASPTENSETSTRSRLASVFELNPGAAHDDTTNRNASTAAIKRLPQLTGPRRASIEWEPHTINQPQRATRSPYPTRSPPQKIEQAKNNFQPSNRYWGVRLTLRAPSRTSLRRRRLVTPTTTRTPPTQICRS